MKFEILLIIFALFIVFSCACYSYTSNLGETEINKTDNTSNLSNASNFTTVNNEIKEKEKIKSAEYKNTTEYDLY